MPSRWATSCLALAPETAVTLAAELGPPNAVNWSSFELLTGPKAKARNGSNPAEAVLFKNAPLLPGEGTVGRPVRRRQARRRFPDLPDGTNPLLVRRSPGDVA